VSSNTGASWAMVTAAAAYHGRQDGQLLITPSGALLVVAGDTGTNDPGNVNDVWASLDGGYTWGNCNNTAGFTIREDHVAILDSRLYLWVMQGEAPYNPMENDVWKSREPFTDSNIASLCKLKIPSCGVGLRCWPTNTRCINHCPRAVEPVDPEPDPDAPSTTGSNSASSGLGAGWIVFIVALVVLLLAGLYFLYRRRSQAEGASGVKKQGELGASLTADTDLLGPQTGDYRHLEVANNDTL